MNNLQNKRGFSLIELTIGIALLGGVALGVAQLLKNMSKGQGDIQNIADLMELKNESLFLIENLKSCKASLSGFTFRGSTIRSTPKDGVELWSVDQAGARSRKIFHANAKFNKLVVDRITFSMPDYTSASDWPVGTAQSFTGLIKISGRKLNSGSSRSFPDISKSINVVFNTDSSGVSTIVDCGFTASTTAGTGSIYVAWAAACPSGHSTLKTGTTFTSSIGSSGSGGTDFLCSSGITRSHFRIKNNLHAYEWNSPFSCSVCAAPESKSCFENWGTQTCPSGFSASYVGHMFQAAWNGVGTNGKIICRAGAVVGGLYVANSNTNTVTGYQWIAGQPCSVCCQD